jgi:hypothetical protein
MSTRSSSVPSQRGHLEDVIAPGWQIEVESLGHEVIAVAIVDGRARQILKSHRTPRQVFKRKMNITLALVPGIVDGDEPPLAVVSLP